MFKNPGHPTQKGTELFPNVIQAPPRYVVTVHAPPKWWENAGENADLRIQEILADRLGRITQFVNQQTQAYALSVIAVASGTMAIDDALTATYLNIQGCATIRLEVHPQLAVKQGAESDDPLCLLVLYGDDKLAAIPMAGLGPDSLGVVYARKVKTGWANWPFATLGVVRTMQYKGYIFSFIRVDAGALSLDNAKYNLTTPQLLDSIQSMSDNQQYPPLMNVSVGQKKDTIYTPFDVFALDKEKNKLSRESDGGSSAAGNAWPYAISSTGDYYYRAEWNVVSGPTVKIDSTTPFPTSGICPPIAGTISYPQALESDRNGVHSSEITPDVGTRYRIKVRLDPSTFPPIAPLTAPAFEVAATASYRQGGVGVTARFEGCRSATYGGISYDTKGGVHGASGGGPVSGTAPFTVFEPLQKPDRPARLTLSALNADAEGTVTYSPAPSQFRGQRAFSTMFATSPAAVEAFAGQAESDVFIPVSDTVSVPPNPDQFACDSFPQTCGDVEMVQVSSSRSGSVAFAGVSLAIPNTDTITIQPFPPSLGIAAGKVYFTVDGTTRMPDIYTPYENFLGREVGTEFRPWLHVSNDAHFIQGFKISHFDVGQFRFVDDVTRIYLDKTDVTDALVKALGKDATIDDVKTMVIDVPLSRIQALL